MECEWLGTLGHLNTAAAIIAKSGCATARVLSPLLLVAVLAGASVAQTYEFREFGDPARVLMRMDLAGLPADDVTMISSFVLRDPSDSVYHEEVFLDGGTIDVPLAESPPGFLGLGSARLGFGTGGHVDFRLPPSWLLSDDFQALGLLRDIEFLMDVAPHVDAVSVKYPSGEIYANTLGDWVLVPEPASLSLCLTAVTVVGVGRRWIAPPFPTRCRHCEDNWGTRCLVNTMAIALSTSESSADQISRQSPVR